MKLAPVRRWLIRNRRALRVVQEGITRETLGSAVSLGNDALRRALDRSATPLTRMFALVIFHSKDATALVDPIGLAT